MGRWRSKGQRHIPLQQNARTLPAWFCTPENTQRAGQQHETCYRNLVLRGNAIANQDWRKQGARWKIECGQGPATEAEIRAVLRRQDASRKS
jgi:hypothetical protein